MELSEKVLTITSSAKKVINQVRTNASDIKRSLNSLTKTDKVFFASQFNSDTFRDYMLGAKGCTIEDCLIVERSIQKHKKDGLTGTPDPKTKDFYSFYFEDNVAELKAHVSDLKKEKTKKQKAVKEVNEGNNFPFGDSVEEDDASKIEYLKLIGFGFFTVLGLCLVLFLFGVIKNPFKSTSVFDADDKRYKILVLPFVQECEYDGSLKNVGYVIEKRLTDLSEKDSLNLNVRYLPNYKIKRQEQDSTWTLFYSRIMQENNADHIIYGSTREENCSSSNSDEVCINYLSSSMFSPSALPSGNLYSPFQKASVPEISEGKLQGNIDMIIYMQAISTIEMKDPYKALYYLDKLLTADLQNKDDEILLRIMKIQILVKLQDEQELKSECENILKLNLEGSEAVSLISICTGVVEDISMEDYLSSLSVKQKEDFSIRLLMAVNDIYVDIDEAKASIQFILDNCSDVILRDTLVSTFVNALNNNHYYEDAVFYASQILKDNPQDFSLLINRGIAYLSIEGCTDKAENDFKNALKIYPNSSNAHLKLAFTYLSKKDKTNFKYHFSKAIDFDPNNPYIYHAAIDVTFKFGAYQNMFEISDEAVKKYPNKWNFEFTNLLYGTFANKHLGNFEKYKKDSLRILEIAPSFFIERDSAKASGMFVIE